MNNCHDCKKDNCDFDAYVTIRDGKLITGTIDGKSIGAMKGKLLDRIVRTYGPNRGRKFIDETTRIVIKAIMLHGFTTKNAQTI